MGFNDWNQETIKSNSGGSKYLRLKDRGDTAVIRVGSPTYVRLTAYNSDTGKYEDAEYVNSLSPNEFNEQYADNEDYKTRAEYIWVVYLREFNGEVVNEASVYAAPPSIRDEMKKFASNSKWGDPAMYDFEIKRLKQNISDKGDDFYSITPDPTKSKMTKEELEKCNALNADIENLMPGVQTLEAFTGRQNVEKAFGSTESLDDEAEAMLG